MKRSVILALVLICSIACSDEPSATKAVASAGPATESTLAFPSLQVFESLNGWEDFSAEGKRERESNLLELVDRMIEDYGAPDASALPNAPTSDARARACQLLPGAMQFLGARWNPDAWTAEDRKLANGIARLAEYIDPTSHFDFDTEVRPTAELRRFVAWFESQTDDPKTLGLMIASAYDGPWVPREAARELEISVTETASLPGGLALELGLRDDGTWCLRGRTDGAVQWVKDLGMPADQPVAFADEQAVDLGLYGWRLRMVFGHPADLYVSDDGEALFYFTTH